MPGPEVRGGAGLWVVQRPAAGPPGQFGGQGDAVVDFLGAPAVKVEQQAAQRAADQFGVGPVRERAGFGASWSAP
ncbi:hypothetical protein [Streptomyces vinaceus]|uniref:hypothetical protein n=1 Tax=Streptomyces TaxID=1883 RepID=UPI0005BD798B|nr:hypothetical protein [Streptomyces sp. DSM 41269]